MGDLIPGTVIRFWFCWPICAMPTGAKICSGTETGIKLVAITVGAFCKDCPKIASPSGTSPSKRVAGWPVKREIFRGVKRSSSVIKISRPMESGAAALMRSISSAVIDRGHGHCPIFSKLFSSISTSTIIFARSSSPSKGETLVKKSSELSLLADRNWPMSK